MGDWATNLYSREFYQLAQRRLTSDGVLQQWVQLHHVSPLEIASELATARSVFPYVALWNYGNQGMLVASNHPLTPNGAEVAARFQESGGMDADSAAKLVDALNAARIVSPEGVNRLIRDSRPVVNTDHNRWIEYATPRYQSSSYDWTTSNRRWLSGYR